MRKITKLAGVALFATLLLAACSTGDDQSTTVTPPPTADTLTVAPTAGTDQPPMWKAPGISSFESMPMSVQISLQKELLPYLTSADQMCAMIAGEVRAESGPKETGGQYYFPLSILGNSGEGYVTLKYFCDKLHRIFTVSNWKEFDPGIQPTIDGTPYEVKFYTGE